MATTALSNAFAPAYIAGTVLSTQLRMSCTAPTPLGDWLPARAPASLPRKAAEAASIQATMTALNNSIARLNQLPTALQSRRGAPTPLSLRWTQQHDALALPATPKPASAAVLQQQHGSLTLRSPSSISRAELRSDGTIAPQQRRSGEVGLSSSPDTLHVRLSPVSAVTQWRALVGREDQSSTAAPAAFTLREESSALDASRQKAAALRLPAQPQLLLPPAALASVYTSFLGSRRHQAPAAFLASASASASAAAAADKAAGAGGGGSVGGGRAVPPPLPPWAARLDHRQYASDEEAREQEAFEWTMTLLLVALLYVGLKKVAASRKQQQQQLDDQAPSSHAPYQHPSSPALTATTGDGAAGAAAGWRATSLGTPDHGSSASGGGGGGAGVGASAAAPAAGSPALRARIQVQLQEYAAREAELREEILLLQVSLLTEPASQTRQPREAG